MRKNNQKIPPTRVTTQAAASREDSSRAPSRESSRELSASSRLSSRESASSRASPSRGYKILHGLLRRLIRFVLIVEGVTGQRAGKPKKATPNTR